MPLLYCLAGHLAEQRMLMLSTDSIRSITMIDIFILGYVSFAAIVLGINVVNQIKDWWGR